MLPGWKRNSQQSHKLTTNQQTDLCVTFCTANIHLHSHMFDCALKAVVKYFKDGMKYDNI